MRLIRGCQKEEKVFQHSRGLRGGEKLIEKKTLNFFSSSSFINFMCPDLAIASLNFSLRLLRSLSLSRISFRWGKSVLKESSLLLRLVHNKESIFCIDFKLKRIRSAEGNDQSQTLTRCVRRRRRSHN